MLTFILWPITATKLASSKYWSIISAKYLTFGTRTQAPQLLLCKPEILILLDGSLHWLTLLEPTFPQFRTGNWYVLYLFCFLYSLLHDMNGSQCVVVRFSTYSVVTLGVIIKDYKEQSRSIVSIFFLWNSFDGLQYVLTVITSILLVNWFIYWILPGWWIGFSHFE